MIKKLVHIYVAFVQRILVGISLFFLYFIGFGLMKLCMVLVNRRALYGANAGWQTAEGYDEGLADCRRES